MKIHYSSYRVACMLLVFLICSRMKEKEWRKVREGYIKDDFWQLFPNAQISILVVKGLDNTIDESEDPYFKALLDEGNKKAQTFIPDENFTQNEVIQEWRQAFT